MIKVTSAVSQRLCSVTGQIVDLEGGVEVEIPDGFTDAAYMAKCKVTGDKSPAGKKPATKKAAEKADD